MFSLQNKEIRDLGILIIRVGIGFMFILHGWPKFSGGPEKWIGLGKYGMSHIGIDFIPIFWGFMAAASEFIGGIHLMLGLFTRVSAFFMFITMLVASMTHLQDGILEASHALESSIIFIGIMLIGAGKYSLDNKFFSNNQIED